MLTCRSCTNFFVQGDFGSARSRAALRLLVLLLKLSHAESTLTQPALVLEVAHSRFRGGSLLRSDPPVAAWSVSGATSTSQYFLGACHDRRVDHLAAKGGGPETMTHRVVHRRNHAAGGFDIGR
jgi:hypothetical protein